MWFFVFAFMEQILWELSVALEIFHFYSEPLANPSSLDEPKFQSERKSRVCISSSQTIHNCMNICHDLLIVFSPLNLPSQLLNLCLSAFHHGNIGFSKPEKHNSSSFQRNLSFPIICHIIAAGGQCVDKIYCQHNLRKH